MDVPPETAVTAARKVKNSAQVVYSPGVRSASGFRGLGEILRLSDEVVLNTSELLQLCATRDVETAVRRLWKSFPNLTVVTTLGSSGCVVSRGASTTRVAGVNLQKLGRRAVNTTGSGDAFLAAYACYTMKGLKPQDAAAWGNLAGALKATSAETRGSPNREQLESAMKRLKQPQRAPTGLAME